MRKVNQMDEFEIDEISSVDFPAQVPARAVIMKNAGDGGIIKRLRLTSVQDGHQHVIDVGAEGHTSHDHAKGEEFGHSHPVIINDDMTVTIGMSDGHTHTVIEKRYSATEALAMLPDDSQTSAVFGGGRIAGDTDMTKTAEQHAAETEAADVKKRLEKSEKRAERAEKMAELTDVQKAHFGSLSFEAQDSFLGNTPAAREAAVVKAAGNDPVVYTTLGGEEIRKSAGSLLLSLAKRADDSEKELAVEKAARQNETFAKSAKETLSNLPGEDSVQIALMKAVAGIPSEEDRKGVIEILKAANQGVTKAFENSGTSTGSTAGNAEDKLEKMATDHFTKNGGTFEKSYKAVMETPEGRKLYRESRA